MPIMECTIENRPGLKWGESGKCYTGLYAKKRAVKAGVMTREHTGTPGITAKRDSTAPKGMKYPKWAI